MGVKFVYVLPFSWGNKETQTKFPANFRKMPGQSRDNPVKILFMCFLFRTRQVFAELRGCGAELSSSSFKTIHRAPTRIPQNCCGNCRGNSGCWGECWGNCYGDCLGDCPCSEEQSNGTLPGSLHSSSPSTPPSSPPVSAAGLGEP